MLNSVSSAPTLEANFILLFAASMPMLLCHLLLGIDCNDHDQASTSQAAIRVSTMSGSVLFGFFVLVQTYGNLGLVLVASSSHSTIGNSMIFFMCFVHGLCA